MEGRLNDRICVPILLIPLELTAEPDGGLWEVVVRHFVEEIGIVLSANLPGSETLTATVA